MKMAKVVDVSEQVFQFLLSDKCTCDKKPKEKDCDRKVYRINGKIEALLQCPDCGGTVDVRK